MSRKKCVGRTEECRGELEEEEAGGGKGEKVSCVGDRTCPGDRGVNLRREKSPIYRRRENSKKSLSEGKNGGEGRVNLCG